MQNERIGFSCESILRLSLDVGEQMLRCGGEIRRVENTIERICRAYGAVYVEVFAIPSVIVSSVRMRDGSYSAQLRRIKKIGSDLYRLEALNAVSRKICAEAPPLVVFEKMIIKALKTRGYRIFTVLFAAAVASASFALVFGGGIAEAIISSIIGVIVFYIDKKSVLEINQISKTGISAFVGGTLASLFSKLIPNMSIGSVIIGTVVLLVPGLAFGGSLRNLLYGDVLSGTLGTVRAFLTAITLALGYIFALSIFGVEHAFALRVDGILFRAITTIVGVAAFAVIFDVPPRHLTAVAFGGVMTFIIYHSLLANPRSLFVCAFIASAASCGYAELLARLEKAPAIVFQVPCSMPILPGISLYNSMNALLIGNSTLSFGYLSDGVQVGGGIACGIALVSVIISITAEIRKHVKTLYIKYKFFLDK